VEDAQGKSDSLLYNPVGLVTPCVGLI
jgi:hypothetical protein